MLFLLIFLEDKRKYAHYISLFLQLIYKLDKSCEPLFTSYTIPRILDMENIQTGLLLLVVGTTTVFAILLLVIYLGKGLIFLVNKYAPQMPAQVLSRPAASASQATVSPRTTAAIVAAVSLATRGEGKVVKIEKL